MTGWSAESKNSSDADASDAAVIAQRIRALRQQLLGCNSATHVLSEWCDANRIGSGPLVAERLTVVAPPQPDHAMAAALDLGPGEDLRHRRVTLRRGKVALSDCDLWWIPARLDGSRAMELEFTERPFGSVIASIEPERRTMFESLGPADADHILELRVVITAGIGVRRAVAGAREMYRSVLAKSA